jgi:hypothetical protein
LVQEPQALDDPVVEIDELGFGESVDVDLHLGQRPTWHAGKALSAWNPGSPAPQR